METVIQIEAPLEPIVLTTDRLHLHNFRMWEPAPHKRCAIADLLIGNSILIKGFSFSRHRQDEKYGMSQNAEGSRPRVTESLLWQRHFPQATPPLGEFLAEAIFDWVFVENHRQIIAYLDGQSETLELPVFHPIRWDGKSLRIEIAFLGAKHFEYHFPKNSNGHASRFSCTVLIDKHLALFETPVYEDEDGWKIHDECIQTPQINQAVQTLLENEALRAHAQAAITNEQTLDLSQKLFLYCVPGCDPKGPPSPITLV